MSTSGETFVHISYLKSASRHRDLRKLNDFEGGETVLANRIELKSDLFQDREVSLILPVWLKGYSLEWEGANGSGVDRTESTRI